MPNTAEIVLIVVLSVVILVGAKPNAAGDKLGTSLEWIANRFRKKPQG